MPGFAELLGDGPAMTRLREELRLLAQRHAAARRPPPVLLLGETGTGKSLIARILHDTGPRAGGPFVDVSCATIPETLAEAELFGFERGAFTDARRAKPGLFLAADRGTIFLDEIARLSDGVQAKLLKVIEEQRVRPLGATASLAIDAWIIAATSEDLDTGRRRGRFREDLYHRLAVVRIRVPPLRERGDDIGLLAEHLLARACAAYGAPAKTLTLEALAALRAYPWPGNIRQLRNVIERAALSEAVSVGAEALELPTEAPPPAARADTPRAPAPVDEMVAAVERERLRAALATAGGNVTRAAQHLGMTRNTLRYRLRKHGFDQSPADETASAPEAAVATRPVGMARWERRRVAFLRVAVGPATDAGEPPRLLAAIVSTIAGFGGAVDGVSPTGVTAVFGLDLGEDGVRRAAQAALAIRDLDAPALTQAIHAEPALLWRAEARVHVDMAARHGIGTTLDRLVAEAEGGAIVVSGSAASWLAGALPLSEAREPGGSRRLLGGARDPATAGGVFVGRREEIGWLQGRCEAALAARGQVVAVSGEPGIGKSRHQTEFQSLLDPARVALVTARCVSHGRNLALLPVVELVRRLCGIEDDEATVSVRTKLASRLDGLGLPADEMTPYLARLMGIGAAEDGIAEVTPSELRRRTLEIVRALVLAAGRARPLVVAIEDLHWMDRASEHYLESLVDVLAEAAVMLVTTSRPGYHAPWRDRSFVTELKLQRLPRADARRVLETALGRDQRTRPMAAETAEAILDRADGNPFFIEELARALGTAPGRGAAIPESIEAVLLARIDQLPDEAKHVLQAASVVGRDVPARLLQAITGDVPATAGHLRELQRLEYLHERGEGAHAYYRFKHALTQQVAYASLLPGDRRALHGQIVTALEGASGADAQDDVETLARHATGGELWEKAVRYWRRAGEKAFHRFALAEADASLEQALSALAHLPAGRTAIDAIDIRLLLVSSLAPAAEYPRALAHLRQAAELAEAAGERRRLGQVLSHQSIIMRISGETDPAFAAGRRALDLAAELGDAEISGRTNYGLGIAHHTRGRFREAVACYHASLRDGEILHRAGQRMPYWATGSAAWLTWSLEALGEFREGLAAGQRAVEMAKVYGDRLRQVAAHCYLGLVHLGRGETGEAVPLLEYALAQCRAYRELDLLAPVVMRLGLAYSRVGRLAEAITLGEEGVANFEAIHGITGYPGRMAGLAECYWRAGRWAEAERAVHQGLAVAREHRQLAGEAECLRALGVITTARAPLDVAAAEAHLTAARDLATSLEMRPLVGHCHLDLARLCAAAAKPPAACEHLAIATEIYRAAEMPGWLREAERVAESLKLP